MRSKHKAVVFFLVVCLGILPCRASAEPLWTWVSGSDANDQVGVYGTKGVSAPDNVPGSRSSATTWTDATGNLWLFGGYGCAASGKGRFNDLWKFDGASWTWISGPNTINQYGVYGFIGVPISGDMPGARTDAVSWIDAGGNFWLFGGYGYAESGNAGYLNDLWKFDGVNWTWVSGPPATSQSGVYGTKGVPASGNMPGARGGSVSWIDGSGNLWLFGGYGLPASSSGWGYLNDLWRFDGANWTWVSGSNTFDQYGVYGIKGVAAASNVPKARQYSVSWTDADGNFWLFGGWGPPNYSRLNDLWKFDGTNWTWVSGSNTSGQTGVYGTKGVAAPGNVPGARRSSVSWIDASGNLWLFGGEGYRNDLWKFDGANWTWVSGSNTYNEYGIYGARGIAASDNVPGARESSVSWIDAGGSLWLFGGSGCAASARGRMNDLWRFCIPVIVPDIVGMTQSDAQSAIASAGLAVGTVSNSRSETVPSGSIISQSPEGGSTAPSGSAVSVVISLAPSAMVPNVVGMTQSAAQSAILSAGLTVGIVTNSYNSAVSSGSVISQSLTAGSVIAVGSSLDICVSLGPYPLWTWVSGSKTLNQYGVYGTKCVPSPSNVPGARTGSTSCTDNNGNLWLFGGDGYAASGAIPSSLNDLWKFDGVNWTWVSGSNTISQSGIYGTKGTAAPDNVPGARNGAVSWTDADGNFWLFGGVGYGASGSGYLNDLWKFDGTSWMWVSGSDVGNQYGIYGTKGVAASGNMPGARSGAVSWTDADGNFWLFGGTGRSAGGYGASGSGDLNDLWKFDGANWTWVSGSDVASQYGIYGTKGVGASGNVPGARHLSVSWTDSSGNLWLFGGIGYASSGGNGNLNDLWKFDGTNWTWGSGSNATSQVGVYGTKGVEAPGNVPGARNGSVAWTDADGNFWLFGGYGYATNSSSGVLNDLWRFNGTNWTWVSGWSSIGSSGAYGIRGVAASGNMPGSRSGSISWTDSGGNLRLFGGTGYAASGNGSGYLNDTWKFDGANWTWVGGSNGLVGRGIYGTKGEAASDNAPGGRYGSASWTDVSGNLWLFGGYDGAGRLNDLWKFDGTDWTWVSGSSDPYQYGIYGTKGEAVSDNVPGGRYGSVSWTDASGNLWLFGGQGYASSGTGYLNDLWKFDGTNWTWVSGSDANDQRGFYSTKGVANQDNVPGARYDSASWIDSSGNLWVFGGYGYSVSGNSDKLNDLWKFDGANWTWVSGSNSIYQSGVYGTKGLAAPGNVPGGRSGSASWIDTNGALWLFGGHGLAASGTGYLNDLWKFDGTNWTWVSGSDATSRAGAYGTKGVAAPGNVPGSRHSSVSWIDASGNLWLFGGYGYAAAGSSGYLNDLWKFDGTNWTWVGGSNTTNQYGLYGTRDAAALRNVPGARYGSVSWIDANGSLWLFGGYGCATASTYGYWNDLWVFGTSEKLADINGDGIVNYLDLMVLIARWQTYGSGAMSADISPSPDGDRFVDFRDFAVLASQWTQ